MSDWKTWILFTLIINSFINFCDLTANQRSGILNKFAWHGFAKAIPVLFAIYRKLPFCTNKYATDRLTPNDIAFSEQYNVEYVPYLIVQFLSLPLTLYNTVI